MGSVGKLVYSIVFQSVLTQIVRVSTILNRMLNIKFFDKIMLEFLVIIEIIICALPKLARIYCSTPKPNFPEPHTHPQQLLNIKNNETEESAVRSGMGQIMDFASYGSLPEYPQELDHATFPGSLGGDDHPEHILVEELNTEGLQLGPEQIGEPIEALVDFPGAEDTVEQLQFLLRAHLLHVIFQGCPHVCQQVFCIIWHVLTAGEAPNGLLDGSLGKWSLLGLGSRLLQDEIGLRNSDVRQYLKFLTAHQLIQHLRHLLGVEDGVGTAISRTQGAL